MPPKKSTKSLEERRKAKKEAEKRRRDKIKADPEKYEAAKLKEQERRKRRKEQKKILSVGEMTPRMQRNQRKNWRDYQRKCRKGKKEKEISLARLLRENTPSSSSEVDTAENEPRPSSPSILRDRDISTTPSFSSGSSVSSSMSRQREKGLRQSRLRRKLAHKIIEQQKETIKAMKTKLHALQVKYNRLSSQTPPKARITKKLPLSCPIAKKRFAIRSFLEDDSNSKLCAGKNDTKTQNKLKKQKRILTDSLERLHQKYNREVLPSLRVSYATFCRLRPFWVVQAKLGERDTCLCALHENAKLIIEKLRSIKILQESSIGELSSSVVCDTKSYRCMTKKCVDCSSKYPNFQTFEDEHIRYKQWIVKSEPRMIKGKEKILRRTVKDELVSTKKELLEKLLDMLPSILSHSFNIGQQYGALKKLKENLASGEVLIHIDFSENYACKYFSEAQSVHFGASRQQISLHTGVLYFRSDSDTIESICFCTISDCLRHDASAVYAHLKKALLILLKEQHVAVLHVASDGPSSQYKNKNNFYLFTQHLVNAFNIQTATWNFSESGHGKGAPDGVGAAIKRTADAHVNHGNDIPDFNTFYEVLKAVSNVMIYKVSEADILEADKLLKNTAVKTIPGTKKAHQLTWTRQDPKTIQLRDLSCTDCSIDVQCKHFPSFKREIINQSDALHAGDYELRTISQSDENINENKDSFSTSDLREGVWVLSKFSGKRNQILTYVGQIISVDISEEPYTVQFTRKKSTNIDTNEYTFAWKDNDISAISYNDIIAVLPEPTPTRRGELIFNFDFSVCDYPVM